MLLVQKLNDNATLPTVVHPGEDLGFDVYASEEIILPADGKVVFVKTGIAARFVPESYFSTSNNFGLLIHDRSGMASKNIRTSAGVIDAGYNSEIMIMMHNHGTVDFPIHVGMKIAQMIPQIVLTDTDVTEVNKLPDCARGAKGFGSSGV